MYSMSETFRVTSVMSSVFAVAAIKESKTGLCRPLNSAFATDSPQVSATDVLYARILCEYCVSNASSKPDNSAARLVSPRSAMPLRISPMVTAERYKDSSSTEANHSRTCLSGTAFIRSQTTHVSRRYITEPPSSRHRDCAKYPVHHPVALRWQAIQEKTSLHGAYGFARIRPAGKG